MLRRLYFGTCTCMHADIHTVARREYRVHTRFHTFDIFFRLLLFVVSRKISMKIKILTSGRGPPRGRGPVGFAHPTHPVVAPLKILVVRK